MGYINSVDEIDEAMISEGIDEILNSDDEVAIAEYKLKLEFAKEQKKMDSLAAMGYGYYLDNCSDKVKIPLIIVNIVCNLNVVNDWQN